MGSLDNYLDIPHQERQALAFVVADADQTVDVFRRPRQAGVAGLTEETKDQQPLRSTRVRIDFYESRSSARGSSPVVRKPIALTNDTDVRVDDLWRLLDDRQRLYWYRVAGVTRTRGASRVVLEEIKR
jgi:hypothetical protein